MNVERKIVVAVAMKDSDENDSPTFLAFDSTKDAHGFIKDIFEKYGQDVGVAVLVDDQQVKWRLVDDDLIINEHLSPSSLIH